MMLKKRTLALILFITVLSTAMVTYSAAGKISLTTGEKVVVDAATYRELRAIEARFSKARWLQTYVEQNYYKPTDDINFDDGIYKGIFEATGDPYSEYLTKEEYKRFNEMVGGEYAGVGLQIHPSEDGFIEVISPFANTPAARAGIKSKDKIIRINDKTYGGKELNEAVEQMRGEPGTKVMLTIYREGQSPFDVTLTRETIRLEAVTSKLLDKKIGYIYISDFDNDVATEFDTHLKALEKQGIKGLVLDLRSNPGGDLEQCVKIADRLLDKGLIVYTQTRSGSKQVYNSNPGYFDKPIAVLINGGSASASEILSGALQDRKAATLFGSTSFGKGVVQSVRTMKDGSVLKLTVAEYFTPSGRSIHGKGIEPDVAVEDNPKTSVDETLERALKIFK